MVAVSLIQHLHPEEESRRHRSLDNKDSLASQSPSSYELAPKLDAELEANVGRLEARIEADEQELIDIDSLFVAVILPEAGITPSMEAVTGAIRQIGPKVIQPYQTGALDDLLRDLPEIKTRTLFITGDKDATVPPKVSDKAAERMPSATRATLSETGHLAHEEAPDQVAALILGFLRH